MSKEKAMGTPVLERHEPLLFRKPIEEDGKDIWQLIKDTGVLDLNSSYGYIMWGKYFDETSVVVETSEGKIVGFISGFIPPKSAHVLFIWQVAVDASQRGKGIATRMQQAILERDVCQHVTHVEATVSPSNQASDALFRKLARDLQTDCRVTTGFTADQFPGAGHEEELLYHIGPFHMQS